MSDIIYSYGDNDTFLGAIPSCICESERMKIVGKWIEEQKLSLRYSDLHQSEFFYG